MGIFYEEFLKNEKITGMIFDVDGTLLDSMPVWNHSGEQYLASIGVCAPPSLGRILFSMTMQQGAEYIKNTYKLLQSEEEIKSGIIKIVEDGYENQVPLKPAVTDFLKALQAAGIPMAVVTSTEKPLIRAAFARVGIDTYFPSVFTCTEFGSGKDRPEIFHAAASAMGSVTDSTWVVEDALYAVRTARAAGYRVIGVSDAASRKDAPQIRGLSDHYISSFDMEYEFVSNE